jgi:glycosyltransferase involved in cell wall biosynthesis
MIIKIKRLLFLTILIPYQVLYVEREAMKKSLMTVIILLHISLLNAHNTILSAPEEPEKIYAVMITGKDDFHKFLAEKSIQSFLEQTYPNKHLIIVNDGNYSLGNINPELITEIKLDKKYILGALRNIGLKQVPENGIYLQWDDDDWHHPRLMEMQYQKMKDQNADGCLLLSQVVYHFRSNTAWTTSVRSGILGTIMCRNKNDVFYPEIAKVEDFFFVKEYRTKKHKLTLWKNPTFYYLRFVHGHNTWNESHFNIGRYKRNQWSISKLSRNYLSKIIPLYTSSINSHKKGNK